MTQLVQLLKQCVTQGELKKMYITLDFSGHTRRSHTMKNESFHIGAPIPLFSIAIYMLQSLH